MSTTPQDSVYDKNWYKDRYQNVLVQRKILTLVTLMSLAVTLAAVLVIAQLTPLKTVEPFVIQVDQKSGITQTVDPLTVKELTANEAINNFYIVQYIRSREAYSTIDLARNYNTVRVLSDAGAVYPGFVGQADPNNPASNASRMGSNGMRLVKFKSISYLNPQLIQARVLIEERRADGTVAQFHQIILLGFRYVKMALTNEERYINPLGFQVTVYRVDEDILQK